MLLSKFRPKIAGQLAIVIATQRLDKISLQAPLTGVLLAWKRSSEDLGAVDRYFVSKSCARSSRDPWERGIGKPDSRCGHGEGQLTTVTSL
ncbi:hypothetical protein CY34DRAFT_805241, partial [Suillus luteus UH-Slu-Lm8-n1]